MLGWRVAIGVMASSVVFFIGQLIENGIADRAVVQETLLGSALIFAAGALLLAPAWLLHRITRWAEGRQKPVRIQFTSLDFLERLSTVLTAHSFEIDKQPRLESHRIALFAKRKFVSTFVPVWTYLYFIVPDEPHNLSLEKLQALNTACRRHTNRQFRLPATMRFVIPLTSTVVISSEDFEYELIDYVRKTRFSKWGDLNDIYLVNAARQNIVHSENLPSSGYLPLNTVFEMLVHFLDIARPPDRQTLG
jgi:hypothetical protein